MILPLTASQRAELDREGKVVVWVEMPEQPSSEWTPDIWSDIHGRDKDGHLTPDIVLGTGWCTWDGEEGYPCPLGPPGTRHGVQTGTTTHAGEVAITIGAIVQVTVTRTLPPEQREGKWGFRAEVAKC